MGQQWMQLAILDTHATGLSALLCTSFIILHSRNNKAYWQLDRKTWSLCFADRQTRYYSIRCSLKLPYPNNILFHDVITMNIMGQTASSVQLLATGRTVRDRIPVEVNFPHPSTLALGPTQPPGHCRGLSDRGEGLTTHTRLAPKLYR
jgi:hypothetical protein